MKIVNDMRSRKIMKIIHNELVKIADNFLRNTKNGNMRSQITFMEFVTLNNGCEIPDCIGFNSTNSTLIECKTSRSDFLADRKKISRMKPFCGMGNFRYYLAPSGIIKILELPENWGLLETDGKKVFIIKNAERFDNTRENDFYILYSALRRLKKEKVFNLIYNGKNI